MAMGLSTRLLLHHLHGGSARWLRPPSRG